MGEGVGPACSGLSTGGILNCLQSYHTEIFQDKDEGLRGVGRGEGTCDGWLAVLLPVLCNRDTTQRLVD